MKELVDTNIWVRFFIRDNEKQYQQVIKWFREAGFGKRKLVVTPVVVAETIYVLESFYHKTKPDIATGFKVALAQRWLLVEGRSVLNEAWQWYEKGVHFVDSYALAWVKINDGKILTFDAKLKRLGGK